jgi:hypothetical protein
MRHRVVRLFALALLIGVGGLSRGLGQEGELRTAARLARAHIQQLLKADPNAVGSAENRRKFQQATIERLEQVLEMMRRNGNNLPRNGAPQQGPPARRRRGRPQPPLPAPTGQGPQPEEQPQPPTDRGEGAAAMPVCVTRSECRLVKRRCGLGRKWEQVTVQEWVLVPAPAPGPGPTRAPGGAKDGAAQQGQPSPDALRSELVDVLAELREPLWTEEARLADLIRLHQEALGIIALIERRSRRPNQP